MDVPLSDTQLMKMLPGVPVLKYSELSNIQCLDDMPDRCIIFLEWHPQQMGHWVCFMKSRSGRYEYFNSMGLRYDSDLNVLSRAARKILGENGNEIDRLLDGAKCVWNKVKYQADDTNTCGRHCCMRLNRFQRGDALPAFKKFMDALKGEFGTYDNAVLAIIK